MLANNQIGSAHNSLFLSLSETRFSPVTAFFLLVMDPLLRQLQSFRLGSSVDMFYTGVCFCMHMMLELQRQLRDQCMVQRIREMTISETKCQKL